MIFPQSEGLASLNYVQFKLLFTEKNKTHSWDHQKEVNKTTFLQF